MALLVAGTAAALFGAVVARAKTSLDAKDPDRITVEPAMVHKPAEGGYDHLKLSTRDASDFWEGENDVSPLKSYACNPMSYGQNRASFGNIPYGSQAMSYEDMWGPNTDYASVRDPRPTYSVDRLNRPTPKDLARPTLDVQMKFGEQASGRTPEVKSSSRDSFFRIHTNKPWARPELMSGGGGGRSGGPMPGTQHWGARASSMHTPLMSLYSGQAPIPEEFSGVIPTATKRGLVYDLPEGTAGGRGQRLSGPGEIYTRSSTRLREESGPTSAGGVGSAFLLTPEVMEYTKRKGPVDLGEYRPIGGMRGAARGGGDDIILRQTKRSLSQQRPGFIGGARCAGGSTLGAAVEDRLASDKSREEWDESAIDIKVASRLGKQLTAENLSEMIEISV